MVRGHPNRLIRRTLYDCMEVHVNGDTILCAAGHELQAPISVKQLAQGKPLVLQVCQNCVDFNSAGAPLPKKDKGWIRKPRKKTG